MTGLAQDCGLLAPNGRAGHRAPGNSHDCTKRSHAGSRVGAALSAICSPNIRACRSSRWRSTNAERCATPQPEMAVSEAISNVQRLWFRGGISREGSYVANGDFGGTLDVSTFLSSFFAFFTAFFSFFACFRSPFVILDTRCAPPVEGQRWAPRRTS